MKDEAQAVRSMRNKTGGEEGMGVPTGGAE